MARFAVPSGIGRAGRAAIARRSREMLRVTGGISIREWLAVVVSLVSLWIAYDARSLATREPNAMLIGPDHVRVAQGADYGYAYLYLQPSLVSTAENDRVEVVRDLTLEVVDGPDGVDLPPAPFQWTEQARLDWDTATESLRYHWVADATPLLVSPSNAQSPLCVFNGPTGWYFEPGEYRLRLRAERTVVARPLEFTFVLTLSPANVDFLNASRGEQFLELPVREED